MSALAAPTRAKLVIALDIRHPLAFLALRPAIAFGRELGIDIDWLPQTSQLLRPPSPPRPGDDRGARHKRHRANMIAREIAIYAQAQGLTLEQPYREGPADAAHHGWLFMRANAPASLAAFLEDLFGRYWALELGAADGRAVADLVAAHGGDAEAFLAFAERDGPAAAEEVEASLAAHGLFQTPAYLVEDEVFYGRQHLPMIRWLLQGRSGPGPI